MNITVCQKDHLAARSWDLLRRRDDLVIHMRRRVMPKGCQNAFKHG